MAGSGAKFISRGDNSGTDVMEKSYWRALAVKPAGRGLRVGRPGHGRGAEHGGRNARLHLTDRATFAAGAARLELRIVVEGDPRMLNPYGVIAVNPARHPGVNFRAAQAFADWLTAEAGRKRIAAFTIGGSSPVPYLSTGLRTKSVDK
jgi:tungstate transport system substrate-binding protein